MPSYDFFKIVRDLLISKFQNLVPLVLRLCYHSCVRSICACVSAERSADHAEAADDYSYIHACTDDREPRGKLITATLYDKGVLVKIGTVSMCPKLTRVAQFNRAIPQSVSTASHNLPAKNNLSKSLRGEV